MKQPRKRKGKGEKKDAKATKEDAAPTSSAPETSDATGKAPPQEIFSWKELFQQTVVVTIVASFALMAGYLIYDPSIAMQLEPVLMGNAPISSLWDQAAPTSPFVVKLTDETFDATVNGNDAVLVEFYAPWCGHCKKFSTPYAEAAEMLQGEAVLGAIDATAETTIKEKYKVQGFPTLVFFQGAADKHIKFTGGRSAKGIVKWVHKRTRGPYTTLADAAKLNSFVSQPNTIAVVGFFGADDAVAKAAFEAHALSSDEVEYGVADAALGSVYAGNVVLFDGDRKVVFRPQKEITDPEATQPESWDEKDDGKWEAPTIVNPYFRVGDWSADVLVPDPDASMPEEWNVEDDGDWEVPLVALSTLPDPSGVAATKEDYDDFVGIERVPMVVTVTKENIQQVVNPYTGITAILFGGDDNLLSQYASAAAQFRGKVTFTHEPKVEEPKIKAYFGLAPEVHPAFSLMSFASKTGRKSNEKYPLVDRAELTDMKNNMVKSFVIGTAIKEHVQAFLDGTLVPFYKSEEIPAASDSAVQVIVGKNFGDVVLDKEKFVFLKVYAPWCGHCKKLAPVWEELANAYGANEAVVVAKMDYTVNEHPSLDVRGYPTLLFFGKGAETGETYEGGRNLADMKEFMENRVADGAE